ncbi:MAG TPA: DUF255 domain-containing protein [Tepidisphaeraceae bacterium]|jgi:hypothetical protein|nr:DUF255 domain-containing protein [Tepidisphaeraceae bacterium]
MKPLIFSNIRRVGLGLIFVAGCNNSAPHAPAPVATTAPAAAIHWEKYSDDVFSRAKKQNKIVLLDLEAVWCHWCHVQDETTYQDPKVIELINAKYIAVKVDQDSRPDISNRYENYGWPATIVFNGNGGEIVKRSGYIPPGPMASMLEAIIDDPTPGPSVGAEQKIEFGRDSALTPPLRKELEKKLVDNYDAKNGGWGTIHKFVDWDAVEFCLMQAKAGDKDAEHRARQTLDGGLALIDPVWGGVYQYSVGGDWSQPHFEKLMQFQADMMRIYALAGAQLGEQKYFNAAQQIRGYIADFLTSPDGAFYVSQDADVIDGQHSDKYFAMDDAARRKLGIPRVDTHEYARETGWGIRGLLTYYRLTQNPADLTAAKRAATWALAARAIDGGGFRHGDKGAAGPYLGDTLSMGRAFLALYEATADRAWLKRAEQAADFIAAHFHAGADSKTSAGFLTAAVDPASAFKPTPQIDENVAAARFFNLLYHYTGRKSDHDGADEAMRYLSTPQIALSRSLWMAGLLIADEELRTEPLHVTVVGKKDDRAARALFEEALRAPTGYSRIEWWDQAQGPLANADVEYPPLPEAAAFVCTGNACSSPMSEPGKLAKKLGIHWEDAEK